MGVPASLGRVHVWVFTVFVERPRSVASQGPSCGLPVSQLFHTDSCPRPLFPHVFLLRTHSPLRLSLQGSISQRQEPRLRVAYPFPHSAPVQPPQSGVALAAAVWLLSGFSVRPPCVYSCASMVVWLDVHATCVCHSLCGQPVPCGAASCVSVSRACVWGPGRELRGGGELVFQGPQRDPEPLFCL